MRTKINRPISTALRQVTADTALMSRIFFNENFVRALRLICGADDIQFFHADTYSPSRHDPVYVADPGRIVLSHIGGTVTVDCDLAMYPALQIVAKSASGATQLRIAIANSLLRSTLHQFNALGLGTWRVMSVGTRAHSVHAARSAHAPRFHVSLLHNKHWHDLLIEVSAGMVEPLYKRLETAFQQHAPALATNRHMPLGWLRIPGVITLGRRPLSIASLRRLRPGDVMLRTFGSATALALSGETSFTAYAVWGVPTVSSGVRIRRLQVPVTIRGTQLTLMNDPMMNDLPLDAETTDAKASEHIGGDGLISEERPMTRNTHSDTLDQAQHESGEHHMPLDTGMLDLPVQFEIDSIALPLTQLAALEQGYVIELSTPAADARIRLVVHGQTVGHGELVVVGENLGLRITKMVYADSVP